MRPARFPTGARKSANSSRWCAARSTTTRPRTSSSSTSPASRPSPTTWWSPRAVRSRQVVGDRRPSGRAPEAARHGSSPSRASRSATGCWSIAATSSSISSAPSRAPSMLSRRCGRWRTWRRPSPRRPPGASALEADDRLHRPRRPRARTRSLRALRRPHPLAARAARTRGKEEASAAELIRREAELFFWLPFLTNRCSSRSTPAARTSTARTSPASSDIGATSGAGHRLPDRRPRRPGAASERASLVVRRQTWPHLLVRAMLAEQVYRAQQLLAGHPYHRA